MKKNNLKKIVKLVTLTIGLLFYGHFASAEALNLPKDENGWTIFTPSADSRIIYVSADGDDDTCSYYLPNAPLVGPDPFQPSESIQPCATYEKAYTMTRNDFPDWILMKRGDVIYQNAYGYVRSGRSVTEPSFMGAYGESGPSPLVKVGRDFNGVHIQMKKFVAVSGLEYYSYTRDPNSPDFTDTHGRNGMLLLGGDARPQEAILVEGCKFRFFRENGGEQYNNSDGITIRRNIFLDSYSEAQGHSQGLYLGNQRNGSMIIEENIFDHNGWCSKVGSGGIGLATIFNHNVYLSDLGTVTLRDNISLRSSSIGFKFSAYKSITGLQYGPFTADNNLIVDAEVGITMAGDNTPQPLAVLGATVTNNVVTNLNRSMPTNRAIGWGIDILSVDGGTINNNLVVHNNTSNSHGISHTGYSRNLTISDNVIYDFKQLGSGLNLKSSYGTDSENVVFSNNKIQVPEQSGYTIYAPFATMGKWIFSVNKYYSNVNNGFRFRLNNVAVADAQWAAETGDNSTFEEVEFPDPTRSIETYMQSIGETGTIDAFIEKCRAQNRYNWDPRFTAEVVNEYIRAGFFENTYAPNSPTGLNVL